MKEHVFSKEEIRDFTSGINRHIIDGHDVEDFRQLFYNGDPTMYLVSSYGRIFSTRYRSVPGMIHQLKPKIKKKTGYNEITICVGDDSKHVTALVHRLVAITWIPNPKNKPEVNHLYPNKSHNYYWNLEWSTSKENIDHAEKHNLRSHKSGESVTTSKFTEKQIKRVCKMLQGNKGSYKDIAKATGVNKEVVRSIKSGRIWKNISKDYDFSKYNHGKSVSSDKAKKKKIKCVCEMLESNKYTIKQISNATGISYSMVIKILNGESYTKISSDYKLSNYKSKSPKNKNKS